MATPQIDYDALAAQHGGTPQIDYDALAAQHGGTAVAANVPAPDTRNAIQKEFDNLTMVTPQQEQGHNWLTNEAQKFGAGVIQAVGGPVVHPEQALEGIANTVSHPIDTAEALARSAYHNPAQAMGGIVGGALLGEGAGAAANAANEVVSNAAGKAALLGKTPQEAYESALRPSVTMNAVRKANAVQAGLGNEIPISRTAVDAISDKIEKLDQQKWDVINTDPNRPISPGQNSFKNFNETRTQFSNQVNPQADLNAIDASRDEFLNRFRSQPGGSVRNMPAQEAQRIKEGTYRVLSKKYGEQGSATVEAQKALARDLKDEIANQFPELNQINASESRLLDLQPVMERAVNRLNNQGMFRLGTGAVAGAIRAMGGSNKLAIAGAIMKQVLDDPMVKSRLAIAVSKGAKIPYVQAVARIGSYSASLANIPDSTVYPNP